MSVTETRSFQITDPTGGLGPQAFQKHSSLAEKIDISLSTVRLDATHMQNKSRRHAVELIAKAVFVAHLMDKNELLLTEVMPWINAYCDRECSVSEAEPWFVSIVEDACQLLEWDIPVMRLTGRGEKLELRCYLGAAKPTDYYYLEDWYCEARENFRPN